MNTEKMKTKITAITLTLILTLSAIIILAPAASAQYEDLRVDPYVFVNAIPNPQEVNRNTLLHVGSVWPCPNRGDTWVGLSITITAPDNSVQVISDITTDSTGSTGRVFTPTQIGTYQIQSHFPEQVVGPFFTGGFQAPPPPGSTLIQGNSEIVYLVVQEDPVAKFDEQPLPSEYWTNPVDAQLWSWRNIAGNWLGDQVSMDPAPPATTLYAEYNDNAPNTGHVLWTNQLTIGGLAGGPLSEPWGFEQSDAYEQKWTGSVIIGGILFFNKFEATGSTGDLYSPVVAVDLHTGEELWSMELQDPNGRARELNFGQTFFWDSYNYHGVHDYLWANGGGYWNAFDPITGRWVYSMQGVPGGTRVYGPKGEIYIYQVDLNDGWMALWNSSRVVSNHGSWRPHGNVYDAEDTADGYEWNVTIPTGLRGTVNQVREGIILGTDCDKYRWNFDNISMWALSIKPGQEGTLLYNREWTTPEDVGHYDVQDASVEDDVFCISMAEERIHWGFRLSTGTEIWGPTSPSQHFTDNWGYSSSNSWDNIYDGKYFSGNYGGQVWCRDVQTGVNLWIHNVTDYWNENLHNSGLWRFRPAFFADGKLYIENTEHNPYDPAHRQAPLVAIDIETGLEVFRIPYRASEWGSTAIIGDSILVTFNTYDERIYAIGKGPSSTNINAPNVGATAGELVMITGRVMDESPGLKTAAMQARFPNGVAAVADEYMTDWMQYVYNHFAQPLVMGVPVKIEVINPNGEYIWFGTATSDAYGNFGYSFQPTMAGDWTLIATFEGSESYYGSTSTAYMAVNPNPSNPQPAPVGVNTGAPMPAPLLSPEPAATINIYLIAAAIAAVAVIVAATIFLRKRK